MMMASRDKPIVVPDDDPDDFPDSEPQNPAEAQTYHDKIDEIMVMFSDLLADDQKDALRSTITSLKKLMVKHWHQMSEADIEVILKLIHDPSCVYLCQHLTTKGVDIAEPVTEIPEGWTFLRQLPEKIRKAEVWEMIVMYFDHLSEAHMSLFAANMSSLAKICDPETFDMVLKVTARPMIQVNIPERYLSPVQDPPQRWLQKKGWHGLRRFCLPRQIWHVLQENQDLDPPGILLQPFGCTSNGSSSIVAWPKKHAPHLRFGPSSY